MNPYEERQFLSHMHRRAPVSETLDILFGDARVGDAPFLPLYLDCLDKTGTPVAAWKVFQRAQRALIVAQYFDYSLSIEGGRAECGVYRGFSALLMSRIARLRDAAYSGADLHLIDSFEGLSEPTPPDAMGTRERLDGRKELHYSHARGHFETPLEGVKEALAEYSQTAIHKGWIPEVFAELPEQRWAFVHIDVDLYEPTRACLDYFVPRMAPGGVIVNDDFRSSFFPGCGQAWFEYFQVGDRPYVILDSGQSVYMNARA